MRRSFAAFVLAIPFVAGPATAQEAPADRAEQVHAFSEVDVAPELIGCSYLDLPWGNYWVQVDFVVATDGVVVPGTARGRSFDVRGSGVRHAPADVVRRAEEIAETCRFAPANRDGEAVAVRFWKRFALQAGPGGHASTGL